MTTITYKAGTTYPIYEDEKEITMEYVDGTNITLLSQVFSSSGYEIKEWNTSENGTGESYKLGTTILVGEDVPTELYAIWQLSNAGRIIIKNGTEELDVSNLLLSMDAYFGKNQPFPYVIITLTKQLIDEDYWEERKKYDLNGTTYTTPPSLIQSQTIFKTNVFSVEGDWIYERIEDNGDQSYKITCVDKSYMMKSTTLEDVFYFTYKAGTYTLPYLGFTTYTKTSGNNEDVITFSKPANFNGDIKIYVDTTSTPKLSRISGDCADIFRIISHVVRGSDYTNGFCIDAGYMYDISSSYTVKEEYTMSEIEALKNSTHISLTGSGGKRADIVTVRANEYCWDTIKSFGLLTNRVPFFYDLAYFVDYDSDTVEDAGNIWIDWGGDDSTITDKDGTEYTNLAINNLSANDDQGSQYMRASQRVMSEGYSFTTKITDATKTTMGNDIKHMYVESTTDNATRDFQTQLIALNTLIRNYKPGDAVQFDIAETIHADKTIETLDPGEIDYVGQIFLLEDDDSLTSTYWKSVTSTTFERITESEIESERQSRFSAYSIARKLVDNQNGITLTNVPLAQTYIAYPSLITQYTWGEPDFMDEESSLSSLESITQDTTLDNTADLTISDNYSAKIAVGNQKLSEIDTDKAGYTGILLEKNVDAELYRLSGYSNGVLQTYINSDGKFMSGNRNSPNRVTIDEDGLKIGDVTPVIPESREWDSTKTYSSGDFVYYNNKAYISTQSSNKGNIPSTSSSYWKIVSASTDGVAKWDSTKTYAVGDAVVYNNMTWYAKSANTGNTPSTASSYWTLSTVYTSQLGGTIITSSNNVKTTSTTGSSSNGEGVLLDSTGLKTYNSSGILQCEVGTDGAITAGAGAIRMYSEGFGAAYRTLGDIEYPVISITDEGLRICGCQSYEESGATDFTNPTSVRFYPFMYRNSDGTTNSPWGQIAFLADIINAKDVSVFSFASMKITSRAGVPIKIGTTTNYDSKSTSTYLNIIDFAKTPPFFETFLNFARNTGEYSKNNTKSYPSYELENPFQRIITTPSRYLNGYDTIGGSSSSPETLYVCTADGTTSTPPGDGWSKTTTFPQTAGQEISIWSPLAEYNKGDYVVYINDLAGLPNFIQCGYCTPHENIVNAGWTWVNFPYAFPTRVDYASITSVRVQSGGEGNDFVAGNSMGSTTSDPVQAPTNKGMLCRHERGLGFFWIAIGH